jgi:hypothetical protein
MEGGFVVRKIRIGGKIDVIEPEVDYAVAHQKIYDHSGSNSRE